LLSGRGFHYFSKHIPNAKLMTGLMYIFIIAVFLLIAKLETIK
jgi:hypothetical protein